jgi:formiminoglutamase
MGAQRGPEALRKALSSRAWHLPGDVAVLDAGDIFCHETELETAQASLATAVALIRHHGGFPVVMGGGHETAWGSYNGLRKGTDADASLGIINLDAHFDLRTYEKGPHSGSPFLQMAEDCEARQLPFHYLCLGVQPGANTFSLFARARDLGVSYLVAEDMMPIASVEGSLQAFLEQHDRLYLSIDLDVFDAAFAPGVSAPCAVGLSPLRVLPLLRRIAASGKLLILDICELNPDHDREGMTAKLGAALIAALVGNITLP